MKERRLDQVIKWGLLGWLMLFYGMAIGLYFNHGKTLTITIVPLMVVAWLLIRFSTGMRRILLLGQTGFVISISILLPMMGKLLVLNAFIPVLLFEETTLQRKWKFPLLSTAYVVGLVIYYLLEIKFTWISFWILTEAIVSVGIATGIIYRSFYWQLIYTKKLYNMNKKLERANQQIERLTAQQVRRKFARDLHDTLTQDLIGINMQLTVINQVAQQSDKEQIITMLKNTQQMLDQAVHQSRGLIKEYRESDQQVPQSLKLGVLSIIDRFRNEYGLAITLSLPTDYYLPARQLADLQQVLNEALMNVVKHGSRPQAKVQLELTAEQVILTVISWGKVINRRLANHFGILNMQERVAKYDGHVRLENFNRTQVRLIANFNLTEES